jgi:hypothetical protein
MFLNGYNIHQGTKEKHVKRIEDYKAHNLIITNLQFCNMIANHQLNTRHIKPISQLINKHTASFQKHPTT